MLGKYNHMDMDIDIPDLIKEELCNPMETNKKLRDLIN